MRRDRCDVLLQNSPPMDTSQQAQALGFSAERGDADASHADASHWEGVVPDTATSYANASNAGELYEEEEVGKTVVSARTNSGIFVCFVSSVHSVCQVFAYIISYHVPESLDYRHCDALVECCIFVVCPLSRDSVVTQTLTNSTSSRIFCHSSRRCKTEVVLHLDSSRSNSGVRLPTFYVLVRSEPQEENHNKRYVRFGLSP